MKFSVVTVCLDAADSIERTVKSVAAQTGIDIDHVIVDGGSTDGTVAALKSLKDWGDRLVSSPDDGIYDAKNKGLALARGDYVGFLNAGDTYADSTALARLCDAAQRSKADAVCGDVVIVLGRDRYRFYSGSGNWRRKLRFGHMPPHPAFYARTDLIRETGGFRKSFRIAGDFDLLLRLFLLETFSFVHVPGVTAIMPGGGISTSGWASTRLINKEIARACRDANFVTAPPLLWSKYLWKIFQYRLGQYPSPGDAHRHSLPATDAKQRL